jgi:hypothetical protein
VKTLGIEKLSFVASFNSIVGSLHPWNVSILLQIEHPSYNGCKSALFSSVERRAFASLLLFTAPPRQSHSVVTTGWFSFFYKQTDLHIRCINSLDVDSGYKNKSFSYLKHHFI